MISLELAHQEFLLRVTHCLTRYHSMFPILMDADTDMVCKKLKQKCFPEKTDQEVLDYLNQQPQWNPLQQCSNWKPFCRIRSWEINGGMPGEIETFIDNTIFLNASNPLL